MTEFMKKHSTDGKGGISWKNFRILLLDLLPMTLEDQITLFLKAYVPEHIKEENTEKYRFG